MKTCILPLIAMVTASAGPAISQEVTGATLGVFYQDINADQDSADAAVTSLNGGLDFGIGSSFAIGGSIESIISDDFDDNLFNATVRGNYAFSPTSAAGLFYAVDTQGDFETTTFGIEFGGASESLSYQVYYGSPDSDLFGERDVLSVAGFEFEFGVANGFSLGLAYDSYTVEDLGFNVDTSELVDLTVSDTSLVARYSFLEGASAYAEIGRIQGFGNDNFTTFDDSDYIAVGAEYKFGRGALFDPRTLTAFGF